MDETMVGLMGLATAGLGENGYERAIASRLNFIQSGGTRKKVVVVREVDYI